MYETFEKERKEIGVGRMAKVYSWQGYAYKCFSEDYPKEWIDYEYCQQKEICKCHLPVLQYYESEFQNTIKMELISGISLSEKFEIADKNMVMKDFLMWFKKIHDVRGLELHRISEELYKRIDDVTVTEAQKQYAKQCHLNVENESLEEETLCHMDYHPLNVMYEGDEIQIIDWVNAGIGKPVWDYARTYVIFYEYAKDLAQGYMEQVLIQEGYAEELFRKAVYVIAVCRLMEHDSDEVRQLINFLFQNRKINV